VVTVPEAVIGSDCAYRERFPLPGPGRVVVSVGEMVTPAEIVGYVVERGRVGAIDVAAALRIPARRLHEFLLVKEGQSVRAGELLARRDGLLRPIEVRAPVDCRAMAFGDGVVLLEGFPSERPVRGVVPGRVVEVSAGEGLTVEGTGSLVLASHLMGHEFAGPVKMVAAQPERVLRVEHIDASCHGAVIVGGVGESIAALERAGEFGAQGVVLGSAPGEWANAALPVPVALTEGFGRAPMSRPAYELFDEMAGRVLYAMRRGRRCWLIGPHEGEGKVIFSGGDLATIAEGARVRIAAGEHTGAVGEVTVLSPASSEATIKLARSLVRIPVGDCELLVG